MTPLDQKLITKAIANMQRAAGELRKAHDRIVATSLESHYHVDLMSI